MVFRQQACRLGSTTAVGTLLVAEDLVPSLLVSVE